MKIPTKRIKNTGVLYLIRHIKYKLTLLTLNCQKQARVNTHVFAQRQKYGIKWLGN